MAILIQWLNQQHVAFVRKSGTHWPLRWGYKTGTKRGASGGSCFLMGDTLAWFKISMFDVDMDDESFFSHDQSSKLWGSFRETMRNQFCLFSYVTSSGTGAFLKGPLACCCYGQARHSATACDTGIGEWFWRCSLCLKISLWSYLIWYNLIGGFRQLQFNH